MYIVGVVYRYIIAVVLNLIIDVSSIYASPQQIAKRSQK
jgi:hypothetical protein